MRTFKISDGDLVVICHASDIYSSRVLAVRNAIQEWVNKRNLQDVTVQIAEGSSKGNRLDIMVFTVNNVFEEQVLKR